MLTEKEAWLYIADRLRTTFSDDSGTYYFVNGYRCYGICNAISRMYQSDQISVRILLSMFDKLHCLPNININRYYWTTTVHGSLARIKFCQEQASKL